VGEGIVIADRETGEERVVHDVALLASDQIDERTAAAIAEVRKTRDGISVKFHDKRAALVDLGRHLDMFPDKVEMTGKGGGPIQIVSKTQRDAAVTAALQADT
jgi:phage terminase small subunit